MRLLPLLCGLLLAGAAFGAATGSKGFDAWSLDEIKVLSSLRLAALPAAPHDPSNAYENAPAAAQLGQRIFADRRFSGNGAVSCASCHQPERQFQDGRPLAIGMATGTRRTMPLAGAVHSPFLFWDGRKDSLWSQALGPLEAAPEHGGNRLAYVYLMQMHYRADYEALFGPLPDLTKLPAEASPLGSPQQQAAWQAMPAARQQAISRVFANIGKAIAAYEQSLQFSESRLDRYVAAVANRDPAAADLLTPSEKNGLRIFIGKGQCITCHNGPLLTDQHFHNTGIAPRLHAEREPGRRAALAAVRDDEFNCLGRFSDARPEQCEELRFLAADDPAMEGAFKTPSLRNVAQRAPYMYAGQLATLDDVIRHYASAPPAMAGHSELKPFQMTEQEVRDISAFLGTLNELVMHQSR
jgi:cytochrome c peroxidase